MVWTKILLKSTITSVLAGSFLLLGGVTTARADDFNGCRRNVDRWESRLDHDVDRHGSNSRQAIHDRHELAEARESCERHFGNNWQGHNDHDNEGDRR